MQSNNILFALIFCVVLCITFARKHHPDSKEHTHAKIHSHEHEELRKPEKRDVHARHSSHAHHTHSHHHHHHKRETEHWKESNLRTGSEGALKPGHDHHHHYSDQAVKRQDVSPSGTGAPAPSGSEPTLPTPDLHLDVGTVSVESTMESCNGVVLEPTFILTSATCVYANHTADPYENITFTLGQETKPVKQVFRNPYWHLTGERKENFALLQLQQPVAHINQKLLTMMAWSSYALEDLGDSFIAQDDNTACTAALKTARNSDVIRHVNDEVITLECGDKGATMAGSPIFRLVNGAPVIYGIYFGHCTTGSLDRATSGSCGARISKQVFLDFCAHAKTENVDLHACDSELFKKMHTNFPTTVFTEGLFNATHKRESNTRSVVLAYHSSASKHFQTFVEDMEDIQRMKSVFDKFHIAVIDVNILPFQVKAVPFFEYRTKSSDAYIPYNDEYEFTKFKKFMDVFGKVGAPPAGSSSFLQVHHFHKRDVDDVTGTTRTGGSVSIPTVQSSSIADSAGQRFIDAHNLCDTTAGYWLVPDSSCACLPTHFGSGTTGNCAELEGVRQSNCQFTVDTTPKSYTVIKAEIAAESTWCGTVRKVTAEVKAGITNPVSGKTITAAHCAEAIVDKVACLQTNNIAITGSINTKTGDPPQAYKDNFEGSSPPSPMTHAPNTHYYTVTATSATSYSVLFDGNAGIPLLVAYKLSNANMAASATQKSLLRNRWTIPTSFNGRIGSNQIYLGRGLKSSPEAVEEGQLNPAHMHPYGDESMDITFNHLNAFPQFRDFSRGVWRKYEDKIINYARTVCRAKHATATFHVVSGVSNYEIQGVGANAFLTKATHWPVAYEGAVPQPNGSPELAEGVTKSIVQPKSVWTVGCCTWEDGTKQAQALSIWANNKPRGVPKHEMQPDLLTLGRHLFPGQPCFHFFPANPQCNIEDNHYTMEP